MESGGAAFFGVGKQDSWRGSHSEKPSDDDLKQIITPFDVHTLLTPHSN